MKEKASNEYDLNLSQYKTHDNKFFWRFILKLFVWIGLLILIYFLIKEIENAFTKKHDNNSEFEIEVELPLN